MAGEPTLIIQVPSGGPVEAQLRTEPPPSVAGGEVVVQHPPTDEQGTLEPPGGGEVVLSVPAPEALEREADEVRRVIARAGTGSEPLVVVVEVAEELREEQLAPVIDAARRTERPVILRVIHNE